MPKDIVVLQPKLKGVRNMRSTFNIMCLITTALIIRTLEVAPLGIGNGLETT